MSRIERFDVPTKAYLIDLFRAMRDVFERQVAAQGEQLDPAWYEDGPDKRPNLYKDQPHLLPEQQGA